MVAGHPITRPRIHLTRVAMPGASVDTATTARVEETSSSSRVAVDPLAARLSGQMSGGAQRTIALDETLQVPIYL